MKTARILEFKYSICIITWGLEAGLVPWLGLVESEKGSVKLDLE